MKYTKNFYQIKSNKKIFNKIKAELDSDKVGYYQLPYEDTREIKAYASTITQKHIVVVGIGGSSLGARAIYEFLLPSNDYAKNLLFLETIDPLEVNHSLKSIDLTDTQFLIISKSGNTIEMMVQLLLSIVTKESRYLNKLIGSMVFPDLEIIKNCVSVRSIDLSE